MSLIPKGNTRLTFESPLGVGAFNGASFHTISAGYDPGSPVFDLNGLIYQNAASTPLEAGWVSWDYGKVYSLGSSGRLERLTGERGYLFDLRSEYSRYLTGNHALARPFVAAALDTAINSKTGAVGILYAYAPPRFTQGEPSSIPDGSVEYGVCELEHAEETGTVVGVKRVVPTIPRINSIYHTGDIGGGDLRDFLTAASRARVISAEMLIYLNDVYYYARKTQGSTVFRAVNPKQGVAPSFTVAHPGKMLAAYDNQLGWELEVYTDGSAKVSPPEAELPTYTFPAESFEVDVGKSLIGNIGVRVREGVGGQRSSTLGWRNPSSPTCLFATGVSSEPFIFHKRLGIHQALLRTLSGEEVSRYNLVDFSRFMVHNVPERRYYINNVAALPLRVGDDKPPAPLTQAELSSSFEVVAKRESVDFTPGRIQKDETGRIISSTGNTRLVTIRVPTSALPDEFFLGSGDIDDSIQPFFVEYRGTRYQIDSVITLDEEVHTIIILRF